MFTRLIPDRAAGENFKYVYHPHQENDALNPRDSAGQFHFGKSYDGTPRLFGDLGH
jgi:hypothetical protein